MHTEAPVKILKYDLKNLDDYYQEKLTKIKSYEEYSNLNKEYNYRLMDIKNSFKVQQKIQRMKKEKYKTDMKILNWLKNVEHKYYVQF
jgi:ABC-type lipoprotein release transport system permease subunit